jgi:L-lactate dehydrogenase (cytochrome)
MADALAQWTAAKLTWEDVIWVRKRWERPLVVKGILTANDARLAVAAGADALVISNHGGRQLDGAPATIDVLGEVASAVGDEVEVLMDGGVRRAATSSARPPSARAQS